MFRLEVVCFVFPLFLPLIHTGLGLATASKTQVNKFVCLGFFFLRWIITIVRIYPVNLTSHLLRKAGFISTCQPCALRMCLRRNAPSPAFFQNIRSTFFPGKELTSCLWLLFPPKLKIKCIRRCFDIKPRQRVIIGFRCWTLSVIHTSSSSMELLHLNCDLLPKPAQLTLSRTFRTLVADNSVGGFEGDSFNS